MLAWLSSAYSNYRLGEDIPRRYPTAAKNPSAVFCFWLFKTTKDLTSNLGVVPQLSSASLIESTFANNNLSLQELTHNSRFLATSLSLVPFLSGEPATICN